VDLRSLLLIGRRRRGEGGKWKGKGKGGEEKVARKGKCIRGRRK